MSDEIHSPSISRFDGNSKNSIHKAVDTLAAFRDNKIMRRTGVALAASLVVVGGALFHNEGEAKEEKPKSLESHYITKARAMAEDLRKRGRLNAKVDFKEAVITHSTGIANWDFTRDTCVMEIDPSQVEKSPYKDEIGFKFFIYHELSHCQTFLKPGGFFAFLGLNKNEQKVMDEFIGMDWLEGERNGEGMDQASHIHEVHSDVQGTLWMLEENIPGNALEPYIKQRSLNWMDKMHNSVAAFQAATEVDPALLKGEGLDEIGKAITGEFILRTQLVPIYFQNEEMKMLNLADISRQRIRSLHSRTEVLGKITFGEAIKEIENINPIHLNAYPTYQFIVKEGKEKATASDEKSYVQRWESQVFGGSMQMDADGASLKIHRWTVENIIKKDERQRLAGSNSYTKGRKS